VAQTTNWVPAGVNQDLPSAARIYDYLLGGGHNFAADRAVGERFAAALPGARDVARLNRAFLRRAVLFLSEQGIDQFLDVGSGIPTVGNVHEIAQQVNPRARVVYIDNEPVAVAHSKLMLRHNELAAAIMADMREPDAIIESPETRRLLDFSRPIGLLMVGVFHFIRPEEDPEGLLVRYRDALVPGSWLALSQFTADTRPAEMAAMVQVMSKTANPIYPRTVEEIRRLFDGWELVEPGLVPTALWRPEDPAELGDDADHSEIYAGVARRP
jgi:hypothetical protein